MQQTDTEQTTICDNSNTSKSCYLIPSSFPNVPARSIKYHVRMYMCALSAEYDLVEPIGKIEVLPSENSDLSVTGHVVAVNIDAETNKFTRVSVSFPFLSKGKLRWNEKKFTSLDEVNDFYNENIEFWKPYSSGDPYIHRVLIPTHDNHIFEQLQIIFSSFLIKIIEPENMNIPLKIFNTHFVAEIEIPDGWTFTRTNTLVDCTVKYFDQSNTEIFTFVIDWLKCTSTFEFNPYFPANKHSERVSECREYYLELYKSNTRILNEIKTMIETPVVSENPIAHGTNSNV